MRLVATFMACCACAQQGPPATAPFPLGIADLTGGAAFIRARSQAILQVDLANGHVVRTWPVDGTPAGLYGGRLVAIQSGPGADQLQVLFLDTGAAQPARKLDVATPDSVNVRDPRFSYQAQVAGDTLRLDWRMEGAYNGGAPADPRVAQSYATSLSGTTLVELRTGKHSAVREPPKASRISAALEDQRFPYQRHYPTWSTEPWQYNSITAWLMGEPNGNNKTVFLVTESHGQRTKHTLITAPDPFAFVALDGSAVLVLASPPDRAQPWVAFSVASGAKIGQVEFTPGVRELSLVGSRVYWLSAASKGTREELTLHAAELASGANLWRLDAGSVESSIRQTRRQ